jgi:hypothetical protein
MSNTTPPHEQPPHEHTGPEKRASPTPNERVPEFVEGKLIYIWEPGDGTRYRILLAPLGTEEATVEGWDPWKLSIAFGITAGDRPIQVGTFGHAGPYMSYSYFIQRTGMDEGQYMSVLACYLLTKILNREVIHAPDRLNGVRQDALDACDAFAQSYRDFLRDTIGRYVEI